MLALSLAMGCPVSRLLDEMSSAEVSLYLGYLALEGLPEDRADWRAAMVASMTVNALCGTRIKIKDLMPRREEPPQDWRETKARFKELAGGK